MTEESDDLATSFTSHNFILPTSPGCGAFFGGYAMMSKFPLILSLCKPLLSLQLHDPAVVKFRHCISLSSLGQFGDLACILLKCDRLFISSPLQILSLIDISAAWPFLTYICVPNLEYLSQVP